MSTFKFQEKVTGHLKDCKATLDKKPVRTIEDMEAFIDDYKKIKRISRYALQG